MYRKNVAGQFVHFQGVDATTGGIKTGVSWTMRRCIDGTFAAGGGTVTEDGTTGWYKCALAQADTNGNDIGFNFTGTGAVPQTINIVTTAADPTDSVRFGLTSLPNAAAGANTGLPVVGTQIPNATAGASNGLLISGTNSGSTTFGALAVTGATQLTGNVLLQDGLTIQAPSTANRAGITVTGNGTGAGVSITGGNGATGNGTDIIANSTNGIGLNVTGKGTQPGMVVVGGATGHGVQFKGGATSGDGANIIAQLSGHGMTVTGVGTTKHGINAAGGATSSAGISAAGGGTGAGLLLNGGTTGHGMSTNGGSTSGDGINSSFGSGGVGHGFTAAGTGSGKYGLNITSVSSYAALFNGITAALGLFGVKGLEIVGSANAVSITGASGGGTGHGIFITTDGGTGDGVRIDNSLSVGHGLNILGGGANHGIFAQSGAGATGDGIKAVALSTNGNGLNLLGKGTGNGLLTTGGASAGGDGIEAAAGGGVDIRGAITGNITGNLSGSVGSVTGAVGSVTAGVTVTTNNDKTGYALTAGERNSVADAWTARNIKGGSSTGRTNGQALATLRNKQEIVAGTMTIYDTDDTTALFQATVTTAAGNPMSVWDPTT